MITLFEKCSAKFTEDQLELLKKAIEFAQKAHAGQKRESGEDYFVHPEVVASMLYDMGMDSQTVIAGLLHDVVEDNETVTLQQISALFGPEIAQMVDGVTKLTKSGEKTYITRDEEQAENLRKMFLAIANDVRVVIIKLADRLHNMRTLEYCEGEKRARKAKETLDVYAPLAHRFGMGAIKAELEDLAFFHLMPEEFEKLSNAIASQQKERMRLLENAITTIRASLKQPASGLK
jgi:GTP pyrophosphokinase